MKLTKKQKQIILDFGYTEEDLIQIEKALSFTDFTLLIERKEDKKVSKTKALEVLGGKEFLNGLSRSAFHWSAVREGKNGNKIYFDSSRLYK